MTAMPRCSKAFLVCPGANVIQDARHRPNSWNSSCVAQLLLQSFHITQLQCRHMWETQSIPISRAGSHLRTCTVANRYRMSMHCLTSSDSHWLCEDNETCRRAQFPGAATKSTLILLTAAFPAQRLDHRHGRLWRPCQEGSCMTSAIQSRNYADAHLDVKNWNHGHC